MSVAQGAQFAPMGGMGQGPFAPRPVATTATAPTTSPFMATHQTMNPAANYIPAAQVSGKVPPRSSNLFITDALYVDRQRVVWDPTSHNDVFRTRSGSGSFN